MAVAREVDRRLQHLGQPPVLTPNPSMDYDPQTLTLNPTLNIPASSSWNPSNSPPVIAAVVNAAIREAQDDDLEEDPDDPNNAIA